MDAGDAATETNRRFVAQANPHSWFMVANDLHGQAVRLYTTDTESLTRHGPDGVVDTWRSCSRSVFLLAGFAIENILKGYLVYENPTWIANGRISRPLRTHSLTRLESLAARVPYKGRRASVLRAFEHGLESWARYPCSLAAADWRDPPKIEDTLWGSYRKLIQSYGRRLQELLARGWRGPYGGELIHWTFSNQFFRADTS